MKVTLSILALLATATYGYIVPVTYSHGAPYYRATPEYNSAIVHSDQAGGNFVYSISEGQAFQAVSPLISTVCTFVAITHFTVLF